MNDTPRNADQNRKRKVGQAQDKMLRCTKKKKKKSGRLPILKASREQSSIHAMQREKAMMRQMKRRCKRPHELRTRGIS